MQFRKAKLGNADAYVIIFGNRKEALNFINRLKQMVNTTPDALECEIGRHVLKVFELRCEVYSGEVQAIFLEDELEDLIKACLIVGGYHERGYI